MVADLLEQVGHGSRFVK